MDKSENMEKLPRGPANPRPGPTLPKQVKQALMVVSKSKLSNETRNKVIPRISIKQKK